LKKISNNILKTFAIFYQRVTIWHFAMEKLAGSVNNFLEYKKQIVILTKLSRKDREKNQRIVGSNILSI